MIYIDLSEANKCHWYGVAPAPLSFGCLWLTFIQVRNVMSSRGGQGFFNHLNPFCIIRRASHSNQSSGKSAVKILSSSPFNLEKKMCEYDFNGQVDIKPENVWKWEERWWRRSEFANNSIFIDCQHAFMDYFPRIFNYSSLIKCRKKMQGHH